MRCHCGSPSSDGCADLGYCTGPAASDYDRALAAAASDAARVHDHRTVAETIADAERAHRALAAVEAAAARALVAEIARDAARLTRWCAGCGVDVWPVYPRERACVRCGAAWPVREEPAA